MLLLLEGFFSCLYSLRIVQDLPLRMPANYFASGVQSG